jgi:hypothetical protein
MAFILVLHLNPTHSSMMVDLLTGHTAMKVSEATDGMLIEGDHVYGHLEKSLFPDAVWIGFKGVVRRDGNGYGPDGFFRPESAV